VISRGPPRAKAPARDAFVDQGRKPEYQRRLETVVVPAVNDADRGARGDGPARGPKRNQECVGSGESIVARRKLKGN